MKYLFRKFTQFAKLLPRMVIERPMRRLVRRAFPPTGNPGTASKPDDEVVKLLRSIDKRLATLESCVRTGIKHKPDTSHIVTGHWND
jgi:hypothetical protein